MRALSGEMFTWAQPQHNRAVVASEKTLHIRPVAAHFSRFNAVLQAPLDHEQVYAHTLIVVPTRLGNVFTSSTAPRHAFLPGSGRMQHAKSIDQSTSSCDVCEASLLVGCEARLPAIARVGRFEAVVFPAKRGEMEER